MYSSHNKLESSSQKQNGKQAPLGMEKRKKRDGRNPCPQQIFPYVVSVVFRGYTCEQTRISCPGFTLPSLSSWLTCVPCLAYDSTTVNPGQQFSWWPWGEAAKQPYLKSSGRAAPSFPCELLLSYGSHPKLLYDL